VRVGVFVPVPYESGVRAMDPGVVAHIRPPNRSVAAAVTPVRTPLRRPEAERLVLPAFVEADELEGLEDFFP